MATFKKPLVFFEPLEFPLKLGKILSCIYIWCILCLHSSPHTHAPLLAMDYRGGTARWPQSHKKKATSWTCGLPTVPLHTHTHFDSAFGQHNHGSLGVVVYIVTRCCNDVEILRHVRNMWEGQCNTWQWWEQHHQTTQNTQKQQQHFFASAFATTRVSFTHSNFYFLYRQATSCPPTRAEYII